MDYNELHVVLLYTLWCKIYKQVKISLGRLNKNKYKHKNYTKSIW
jgi:hypothetical protein